jgi:hypothetical protein
MANTFSANPGIDKLYLFSGEFSSTVKTSLSTIAIDTAPTGIEYDGSNVVWSGFTGNKLFLQSGIITSTIKTSISIVTVGQTPYDISEDSSDASYSSGTNQKYYLLSGKFSSSIKTSTPISPYTPVGLSYMEGNSAIAISLLKLWLMSGQYTRTVKTSLITTNYASGISFNGTDGLISKDAESKLIKYSGYFTSTVKTSITTVVAPWGIGTTEAVLRRKNLPDTPTGLTCTIGEESNTLNWTAPASAETYNLYWLNTIMQPDYFNTLDSWESSTDINTGTMTLQSGRMRLTIPDSGINSIIAYRLETIPDSDFRITIDIPGYSAFDTTNGPKSLLYIGDSGDFFDYVTLYCRQTSAEGYSIRALYVDSGAGAYFQNELALNERATKFKAERSGSGVSLHYWEGGGWNLAGSHDYGSRSDNLVRTYLRCFHTNSRGGYVEFDNLKWNLSAQGTKIESISTVSYVHSGLTGLTPYYYAVTAVNVYGESDETSSAVGTPYFMASNYTLSEMDDLYNIKEMNDLYGITEMNDLYTITLGR